MSGWVWLSLLLAIGGVVTIVASAFTKGKGPALASGVAALLIALFVFWLAGFKEVPNKTVGVMVALGKVEGIMTPGLHHTWPWKTVYLLPETIQTSTFEGGWTKDGQCLGLPVRIGGQQYACLDATIQWQIKDSAAPGLFNNYNTGNQPPQQGCENLSGGRVLVDICNAVVAREFRVAVNQVLGDYNPIQDVALNSGQGNSQFTTFGPQVTTVMRKDIGGLVSVRPVYLPFLHYDGATQARLNAIQQQYGATAIANELVKTNDALALANKAIDTKSLTPGALQAECYSIIQEAIKSGFTGLPQSMNCSGTSPVLTLSGK